MKPSIFFDYLSFYTCRHWWPIDNCKNLSKDADFIMVTDAKADIMFFIDSIISSGSY